MCCSTFTIKSNWHHPNVNHGSAGGFVSMITSVAYKYGIGWKMDDGWATPEERLAGGERGGGKLLVHYIICALDSIFIRMFNQPSEKENVGAVCVREREKKTTTMGVAGDVDGFAFWATDSILSLFLLNTDGMRQNEYLTIHNIHSDWIARKRLMWKRNKT